MNIRSALLQKLHGCSSNDLQQIISDGIHSKEETILPGLGVLFEEYYLSLNDTQQNELLQSISQLLK